MTQNNDKPRSFNADAKTKERQEQDITIGGTIWHPRPRTGKVAREIAELGSPPEQTKPGEDVSPDKLPEVMDYMYASIAMLIHNDDGESPTTEWLSDHLEWDVANELMEFLNPDMATPPTPEPEKEVAST